MSEDFAAADGWPAHAEAAREAERRRLEEELRRWMAEPVWREDEARFERLAREVFRHQYTWLPAYRRFCRGRSVTPESLEHWSRIPAVPAAALKELRLASFPPRRTRKIFRSSGTTSGRPSELHLDTLALYEASLVASFERGVLPELVGREGRARLLVLAPSAAEAPDSSLSHMFETLRRGRGDARSGFFVRDGELETEAFLEALVACHESRGPVALCGTAFAWVHLLDAMAASGRRVALPPGARILETGGFKGRAREIPREAFYAELGERLGVPPERIVGQYGMTELGSQFYDSVLTRPGPRRKLAPPWTRVQAVDPATGAPRPGGESGLLRILDLANLPAVAALETEDRGHRVEDGFEVEGRAAGAEARGCSIAADEMLGARA